MKLEDQAVAQEVFAAVLSSPGEGRWLWGELAVSRITDQALLARIAENEERGLRAAAVWRLEDQSVLSRLALTENASELRRIATTKLTAIAVLKQIARDDGDWFVRRAASERLKELGR